MRSRYKSGGRAQSPSFRLKEALISLAVFGYGNEVVTPNPDYRDTFEGFQSVLRTVLPPQLGFQQLSVEMPEVVLQTKSGPFSLDAVSGGVSTIIDLTWQIYIYSLEQSEFSVIVDEPENHLHPELQQRLLPTLMQAFPSVQFIISTHNPFMVSSVPDSNVYVLKFDEERQVSSQELDFVNKAGTANDILRDVLGLDYTMPIWASQRLEALIDQFSTQELDGDAVADLRSSLEEIGLGDAFPEAVARLPEWDDRAE